MTYDLVVVGGGLAGLNAAWECQKAGKSVLVLEARDRVGGRTLTDTHTYNNKESHFDLGAHFIGHERYQSTIWKLVEELGLEVFPQYDGPDKPVFTPGSTVPYWAGQGANLQSTNGQVSAYIGTTIPPSDAGQHYMMYLQQLCESMPLSAPHRMSEAENYDAMSVWDWVCKVNLPGLGPAPESFKLLTRMLCRVGFSAEPENISMLWLLFYVGSSGGLARFQSLRWPIQGAQGYRLVKGAQSISEELVTRLQAVDPDCVKLEQQVTAVKDDGHGVLIECKSNSYNAKRVLIAMAPVLCNEIQFTPPLSSERLEAGKQMSNSSMIMTYVTFDETFWRENKTSYTKGTVNGMPTDDISRYGLSGDALLTDGPVVWVMDSTSAEGQPALFAFIVGEEARKLAKQSKIDREQAVLKVLTDLFGADVGSSNPQYYEMDWNQEPFSKGCPASHFVPGAFLKYGPHVLLSGLGHHPHGNVFFASTEASTISNGYMDGAVWSGQQVAYDIRKSLGDMVPAIRTPMARELEMRWCVEIILTAIEMQNPVLEFPALADNIQFWGPGGTSLPTGPYDGKNGTFAFYLQLAEYFSISSINVEAISVDVKNNTAYASWKASGVVNANGNPFHDVEGAMMFEFTPPGEADVLIVKDWLFMDAALIDAMVAAPPSPIFSTLAEDNGLTATALDGMNAIVEQVSRTAMLQQGSQTEKVVVYGPGGKALPRGPYLGDAGLDAFNKLLDALNFTVTSLVGVYLDKLALTQYVTCIISGTSSTTHKAYEQPLMMAIEFDNSLTGEIASIRYFTDGLALD